MKQSLVVIDDFLDDAALRRLLAVAPRLDYRPREYGGHTYSGIGGVHLYWPMEEMARVMRFEPAPVISFFRLARAEDRPTTWIHNDLGVLGASWAALLYLSDPPAGMVSGTAFWRHRPTGWREQPWVEPIGEEMAKKLNREGQTADAWDRVGFVEARVNRFVAYPANVFHSRYPYRGWGDSPKNGRLIWAGFFGGW